MNLVTPKVGANHELLFNEPTSEGGFLTIQVKLEQLRSVVTFAPITVRSLITPKAKWEHMFMKLRPTCRTNAHA